MNFSKKPIYVKSSDNIHTLSGILYIPDGEIKGIFHLVHGMTEYIGRYDHVMSAIAQNGFLCCGYDNLGHGKTAKDDSELGFIASKNGWKFLVDDTNVFESAVKSTYKNKRLIVMGHSMGSFIVRAAAEKYGCNYSKLIICGTGGPNPAAPVGLLLSDVIKFFKGEKYISKAINNMAFGTYNKRFENTCAYDWITADRDNVEKYKVDKYCTFLFTTSAMHDLVMLNYKCNRNNWFKKIRKDMPILLISGEDDPVGDYGKGVRKVYSKLKSANVKDVKIKLYKGCRHEIHNDICKDIVISDIIEYINL